MPDAPGSLVFAAARVRAREPTSAAHRIAEKGRDAVAYPAAAREFSCFAEEAFILLRRPDRTYACVDLVLGMMLYRLARVVIVWSRDWILAYLACLHRWILFVQRH